MRPVEPHDCEAGPPRQRGGDALPVGPGMLQALSTCEYTMCITYCCLPALGPVSYRCSKEGTVHAGLQGVSGDLEMEKIQALLCRA